MEIREPEAERNQKPVMRDGDFIPENICIVTGCGTGIGRTAARAAAADGLRFVGLDIFAEEGQKRG